MILKTNLLEHQRIAADKLTPIRVGGLFMDMGTGKSRTAIEMAARRRAEGKVSKVIWFAPVSLKETVRHEINKHSEGELVHVFDDKTSEENLPNTFWYIVGIESMSSSQRSLYAVEKLVDKATFVIVDESSYIKGHRSARTEWITKLASCARYRLILTGTPISQGIVDLYSQMRFLDERILGFRSFYSFANKHLEYSDKYPGLISRSKHTDVIAAKIAPYVYQVKKEECLTLPPKIFSQKYFYMSAAQAAMYAAAKEDFEAEVMDEDPKRTQFAIFRLFGALQQITCGFWNRRNELGEMELYEAPHERLELLDGVVSRISKNEKVIIWAKFRRDIQAICEMLPDAVPFYGDMTEDQRNQNLARFRNGARFFVATQDTGGHGLTLNEAAYVIFYTNGFKYASRVQAEDRNYRIGQTRKVTYIDLLCSGSIDERIQNALQKKGDAVAMFRDEVQKVRNKKADLKALIKGL